MKILYDVMGGDHGPKEIIQGALIAEREFNIIPVFVGDQQEIKKTLDNKVQEYEIISSDSVIFNEDEPVMAIRRKQDSSMVMALKALETNKYDGLISTGSTGSLLAGGLFITRRLPGVNRSPIALEIPTLKGRKVLLDAGANVDVDSRILEQFAMMGSIYFKEVFDVKSPKVSLLNIGLESNKGNELSKETYEVLSKNNSINFIGNIEADKVPFGEADVIVTDGFAGNILLKTYEGVAKLFGYMIEQGISTCENEDIAFGFSDILNPLMQVMDYSKIAGAPLLGLNKPVFKAHGNSKSDQIVGATRMIVKYIEGNVINILKKSFHEVD